MKLIDSLKEIYRTGAIVGWLERCAETERIGSIPQMHLQHTIGNLNKDALVYGPLRKLAFTLGKHEGYFDSIDRRV